MNNETNTNNKGVLVTVYATLICGLVGFAIGSLLVYWMESNGGIVLPASTKITIVMIQCGGLAMIGLIAGLTSWAMCHAFIPQDHVGKENTPNERTTWQTS